MANLEVIANSATPGVATALGTLGAAITTTSASTITASQAPPAALQGSQFRVVIDNEILLVAANTTTTTWTVTRGVESTTAATHSVGAAIWHTATAQGLFNALTLLGRSTQGGTTYTLAATDMNSFIDFTNGSAITVTVPNTTSVAWLQGCQILMRQGAAGVLGISAAAGVTVNSRGTLTHSNGLQALVGLIYEGGNAWTFFGDRA